MSLIHFGYLQRKRMVTLMLILALTSALFSVTAYSFLGFYNGFTNYAGEAKDVVAVYSKVGSTPFSGVVTIDLSSQIEKAAGVVAVSPEVIAPAIVNGQSLFIRGIIPEELVKLDSLSVLRGQALNITDADQAIIGEGLANRLHLSVGDKILAFSVLTKRYTELEIKGIFRSDSSLNDEALVPLYVGQWIRGVSYNDATFLRVKIDLTKTDPNQIQHHLTNSSVPPLSASPSPTSKSQIQRELEALVPLAQLNVDVGTIGIEESQQFMHTYLDRFGISKDTLIVLSVVVLVFSCGTAACAIGLFVKQHSTDLDILRSIGVSNRKLKADLTVRMVVWAALATLLGTAISVVVITVFQGVGYLQVLSHAIAFQLDPTVALANFGLLCLLICFCNIRMEMKS